MGLFSSLGKIAGGIVGGPTGAALGGALGGGLDSSRDNRDFKQNRDYNTQQQSLASDKSYKRQKEFTQNTIGWRVADAKRSGIHPLFALGATPNSFSPSQFIPGQGPTGNNRIAGDGIDVNMFQKQSKNPNVQRHADLTLQGLGLDNDIKRLEAKRLEQMLLAEQQKGNGVVPLSGINQIIREGTPLIPGQKDTAGYSITRPAERVSESRTKPGVQAGAPSPGFKQISQPNGRVDLLPSQEYGEVEGLVAALKYFSQPQNIKNLTKDAEQALHAAFTAPYFQALQDGQKAYYEKKLKHIMYLKRHPTRKSRR